MNFFEKFNKSNTGAPRLEKGMDQSKYWRHVFVNRPEDMTEKDFEYRFGDGYGITTGDWIKCKYSDINRVGPNGTNTYEIFWEVGLSDHNYHGSRTCWVREDEFRQIDWEEVLLLRIRRIKKQQDHIAIQMERAKAELAEFLDKKNSDLPK